VLAMIINEVLGRNLFREWQSQQNNAATLGELDACSFPDFVRVRVIGGEFNMCLGTTSKAFHSNGNDASIEFQTVGVTNSTLPEKHAVIKLDQGTCCLLPYANLQLLNDELFEYLLRASSFDLCAIRTLGVCLMEGLGGIERDWVRGGYWLASAAGMGDPWSSQFMASIQGEAGMPEQYPRAFNSLAEAEVWEGWIPGRIVQIGEEEEEEEDYFMEDGYDDVYDAW
jgi:hypothetical protein